MSEVMESPVEENVEIRVVLVPVDSRDVFAGKTVGIRCCYRDGRGRCGTRSTYLEIVSHDPATVLAFCRYHAPFLLENS